MKQQPLHLLLLVREPEERASIALRLYRAFNDLHIQQVLSKEDLDDALKRGGFDLVITDEKLEWLASVDVLKELKKRWPELPIMLVDAQDREKKTSEGAVDGIVPPGMENFAQLPGLTRQLLEGRGRRGGDVEKYRAFFEASLDGVFLETIEGVILDCNQAACDMYGYVKDELIGMDVRNLLPKNEVQFLPDVIDTHRDIGGVFVKSKGRRKDGTIFPEEISTRVVNLGDEELAVVYVRDISERQKVEEQNRLQIAALTATDLSVVISDLDNRILWVNPAFTRMTGYTRREVIGKDVMLLRSGETPQAVAELQDAVRKGEPWQGEVVNRRKDGSYYHVALTMTPVYDSDGEVTHFVSLRQDISERREREDEIACLAKFPSEDPNPVLRIARNGTILYANRASDALLHSWGCAVEERVPERWREVVQVALRSGACQNVETDLDDRVYSLWFAPIEETRYVNVYGLDITSNVEAMLALQESESRYRTLFEEASDALIIGDEGDQILDVNQQACEMFGYTRGELLTMKVGQLTAPEALPPSGTIIAYQLQHSQEKPLESVNLHKSGERIFVEVTSTRIVDRGKPVVLSIVRDITERKEVEARERRHRERLNRQHEALIRLSTHPALTEGQLDEGLSFIARIVSRTINVGRLSIWKIDPELRRARCLTSVGGEGGPCDACQSVEMDAFPAYFEALERRLVVAAADVADDPRTASLAEARWLHEGVRATLDAAVRVHGRVVGIVCCEHLGEARAWTPDEIGFATQVADMVAQLFLNADLHRRAEELMAITRVSREITSEPNLEQVLTSIARHAADLSRSDACLVFTADSEGELLVTGHGLELSFIRSLKDRFTSTSNSLIQRVMRRQRVIRVPDVLEVPYELLHALVRPESLRALLFVPMEKGEELVGGIVLAQREPRHFSQEEMAFLQALAQQCVNAVENAHFFEVEYQQRQQAENLYRASRIIGQATDVEGILRGVMEVAEPLGFEATTLILIEETDVQNRPLKGVAHTLCTEGDDYLRRSPIADLPLREDREVADRLLGDPDCVVTYRQGNGASPKIVQQVMKEQDLSSLSFLGLNLHSQAVGFLGFSSYGARPPLSSGEVRQLRTLSDQVAVAMENLRLFQSVAREKSQFEVLYRLSQHVSESLEIQEVAQHALLDLCEAVGAQRGIVLLHDLDHHELVLTSASGRTFDTLEGEARLRAIAFGEGLAGWVAQHRQSTLVNDVREDDRWKPIPDMDGWVRAALSIPLVSGDLLVGVLTLYSDQVAFFSAEHLRLAESSAATIALAIANANLFEEARRLFWSEQERRKMAEALEEAAAVVNSNLNPDEVLDRILEQVARVVDGDTFNVMMVDGEDAIITRWRGYETVASPNPFPQSMPISSYPTLRKMMEGADPIVIPDTRTDPEWVEDYARAYPLLSYVGTPIRVGGETVGFLNVNSMEAGKFGPSDAARLKAFANHAAIAIQNARLFQALCEHAEHLEARVAERTAELQVQYARLEAVLRNTTDGFVVTDLSGAILHSNPVAEMWLNQVLSGQDAVRFRDAIRELALEAESRPDLILELTGLDLQLKAAPIHDFNSEGARVVVAVHDVSHLKALERMKSQFISDVSHELRTPITTINLYAQLLRQSQGANQAKYLSALEGESQRLGQMIKEILRFSRIDSGRVELHKELVDLNLLVAVVVDEHRMLAEHDGVTLSFEPAESPTLVHVDREKMERVFRNLLINATRYTEEGDSIRVSTDRDEVDDERWIKVRVADTGIGILPEELPHVFERFFRGSAPRQKQIAGTGLGLAIVKEIVELHGGWVTVDSTVDEGSTFTVWLPPASERRKTP
jgi:PAS domain S-box-containing protein